MTLLRPPTVVLPQGDPQALAGAARVLHHAAARTAAGGQRLETVAQGLVDGWTWCGPRSTTYTTGSTALTAQSRQAAGALEASAEAVLIYARDLEVAQRLARAAQQHAERVDRACTSLEWRLAAAGSAVQSTAAAAAQVVGPPSGVPSPQAQAADSARSHLAALQLEVDQLRLEVQAVEREVRAFEELVASAERALQTRLTSTTGALDQVARPPAPAPEPQPHHWYDGVLHQAGGVATGLYDGVAEPVKLVGGLAGIGADAGDTWKGLGKGLAHGVTHPLDLAEAAVDWKDLADGEYGHWVGELAPSIAAAFLTGGAAAGVKGAEGASALTGVERAAAGVDRVLEEGSAVTRAARTYEFDMVRNPGPLAEGWRPGMRPPPAATFAGGKYDRVVLEHDTVLYRGGDSAGNGLGQFFTSKPPTSVAEVRIDGAVRPHWVDAKGHFTGSSPIDAVFEVRIPKGTETFVGPVANQGGVHVGGQAVEQIYVHQPWTIDGVEVLTHRPLR